MQMMIELNVLTSAEIASMPSSKRLALLETFWAQGAAKCGEKGLIYLFSVFLVIKTKQNNNWIEASMQLIYDG